MAVKGLTAEIRAVGKKTCCLTSTEAIGLVRDGENWGKGVWRWGEEGDYIPIATLSPPE